LHHIDDHRSGECSQPRQRRRRKLQRAGDRDRSLRDAFRVVADSLELVRRAQSGEDLAQVDRHRLAERKKPHDERLDLELEPVGLGLPFDHLGREVEIRVADRAHCIVHLGGGQGSELQGQVTQDPQLVGKGLDQML
jgi:hypothetical protein